MYLQWNMSWPRSAADFIVSHVWGQRVMWMLTVGSHTVPGCFAIQISGTKPSKCFPVVMKLLLYREAYPFSSILMYPGLCYFQHAKLDREQRSSIWYLFIRTFLFVFCCFSLFFCHWHVHLTTHCSHWTFFFGTVFYVLIFVKRTWSLRDRKSVV